MKVLKKILAVAAKVLPHAKAAVALAGAVIVAAQASVDAGGTPIQVVLVVGTAVAVWLTKNKV